MFAYNQKRARKYYEGGPSSTPTLDGNRVFTFSKSGWVHCLDAANGDVIWRKDLANTLDLKEPTWGFAGSPLVRADRVIFNAGDSGVALDKQSGEVVWSSGRGPGGYSTPVPFRAGEQQCVALMGKSELIAVQVDDGKVLWRYPWKTSHDVNAADPIVIDNHRFFITSGYGHGCALVEVNENQPKVVWENKNMRSQFTSPVLWEDHLYGVDNKQLVCLDVSSGNMEWKERSVGKGSLMLAGGLMLVLSDKGELAVVAPSPTEFEVISKAQVLGGKCWTVPVLSNGRVYCRNARGDVVCLDVGAR
jgi:outer membrane protein assembly factor BamB